MRRFMITTILAGLAAAPIPAMAAGSAWCPVGQRPDAAVAMKVHLKDQLARVPQPVAHVHTEGTLPHQGIWDASIAAERDLPVMREAGLVWHATGDEAYFALANRLLVAWADTYQPNFNPIDETGLDALAQTYGMIQMRMAAPERARVREFLVRWAQGYIARMDEARFTAKPRDIWANNWQSHRVKLVTMIAGAIDSDRLFADARRLFWLQLRRNVHPDGEVMDFALRDALHYVTYDLEPLLQAALAARTRGEDWYHASSPDGGTASGSLAQAVQWLKPYADGSRPHDEFVHSTVPFDATRAHAGLKGFTGPFDVHLAGPVFWLASVFDPSYAPLAQTLRPKQPPFLALCGE